MAKWSGRERLWFLLAVPISCLVVVLWVGPVYLKPLPIWLKLLLAVAGVCVIAAIAIFSRRRARRASRPDNLA